MSFLSIKRHARNPNRFAVVFDFVLIVFAVLIAILLSDWNKERKLSAAGKEFTAQLVDDLREEAWIYNYVTAYHEDVLKNTEAAEKYLDGRTDLSDEKFLISAYRASQYTWWNPRRTTFDELVGTGNLERIEDKHLRRNALAVYASPLLPALARSGQNAPYRQIFRQTIPTHIQQALAKACGDGPAMMGDYPALSNLLSYDCALNLSVKDIETSVQALIDNPDIAPTLRLRIATLETELLDLNERNSVTLYFETLKENADP